MLSLVIVLLAVYGLIIFLWQLNRKFHNSTTNLLPNLIVIVGHASQWIEWFVRQLSLQMYTQGQDVQDVFIVDLSASDETAMIISKLSIRFPFVTYIPSSTARCWTDVSNLLETSQRDQTLVVKINDEGDMRQVLRMLSHFEV
ncbi:hypothetical protein [Sulfoacidibacillus thermotolerans]|uniref:Glycosyltransferase 2-like domain-containing protein n=1 Tax=Sulfoacidibacillus thermotolerans TaxID=1765684 RepID=A0A2U3D7Q7_SULT2|nr:hypothetical protein [Sulfoacidibacillus thermotolerans]PWI57292.1 hypothetical protein BM613_09350 [Sulfoacidibacillus thermotolerans]